MQSRGLVRRKTTQTPEDTEENMAKNQEKMLTMRFMNSAMDESLHKRFAAGDAPSSLPLSQLLLGLFDALGDVEPFVQLGDLEHARDEFSGIHQDHARLAQA